MKTIRIQIHSLTNPFVLYDSFEKYGAIVLQSNIFQSNASQAKLVPTKIIGEIKNQFTILKFSMDLHTSGQSV